MAARCMRARKEMCERLPIKVSSPESLPAESDPGPATNTGQSNPFEALASAETFLAASHIRPAARIKRRFEPAEGMVGAIPFRITRPGALGRYESPMTPLYVRRGAT